jgi:HK97 family phage major capsid protein
MYNDISIQLLEQSPINMDAIIFGDLAKDLALAINTQVTSNNNGTSNTLLGLVYQGINSGTSVTWTQTTPDATGLVPALGKALSGVANNRYQDAEAIIMSASEWYSVASLLDTTNRPLFAVGQYAFNPLVSGNNLANSSGLVGTYGGVPVYVDATMPKTVSTNQSPILVGKFSDTYLFKGAQKAGVFPDVGSSTLTVRFRLYQYVALAHRFAKSISAISGTGTVPTSGF